MKICFDLMRRFLGKKGSSLLVEILSLDKMKYGRGFFQIQSIFRRHINWDDLLFLKEKMETIEKLFRLFTQRPRDGHKGTFGTVLVIGGSWGMSGAAALCSLAALRSGAGLVKTAVPERILPLVSVLGMEYTTFPLPETQDGKIAQSALEQLLALAQTATVCAVGPGLGRSKDLDLLITELWKHLPIPTVFDADALNALAEISSRNEGKLPEHMAERVLTPHPGEFARLMPDSPPGEPEIQRKKTVHFARMNDSILVLKGPGSLVTDGVVSARNTTGNPGMGTGGSGDVLTGIAAALCAQAIKKGISLFDAVRFAVWLHGKAGDEAARKFTECGMIASDILNAIPVAWKTECVDC